MSKAQITQVKENERINHRGHRGEGKVKSSKLLIFKKFSVLSVVSFLTEPTDCTGERK